jgi:hypothetical protein
MTVEEPEFDHEYWNPLIDDENSSDALLLGDPNGIEEGLLDDDFSDGWESGFEDNSLEISEDEFSAISGLNPDSEFDEFPSSDFGNEDSAISGFESWFEDSDGDAPLSGVDESEGEGEDDDDWTDLNGLYSDVGIILSEDEPE